MLTEEGEGETVIGGDGQNSSGYNSCSTSVNSTEHINPQDQTGNCDQPSADPISETSPLENPGNTSADSGRTAGPNVFIEAPTSKDDKGNLRVDVPEFSRNGSSSENA